MRKPQKQMASWVMECIATPTMLFISYTGNYFTDFRICGTTYMRMCGKLNFYTLILFGMKFVLFIAVSPHLSCLLMQQGVDRVLVQQKSKFHAPSPDKQSKERRKRAIANFQVMGSLFACIVCCMQACLQTTETTHPPSPFLTTYT